jgi:hypothetical protein
MSLGVRERSCYRQTEAGRHDQRPAQVSLSIAEHGCCRPVKECREGRP